MKKIEIHVFSNETSKTQHFKLPIWKIAVGIVAVFVSLVGYCIFSPMEITDKVTDGNVLNVYRQNSSIKKEIKQIREKVDESILKAEETRIVRDSTVMLSGMGFTLESANAAERRNLIEKSQKSIVKIEQVMHKTLEKLEQDSLLAASIPILHPIKNRPTIKNRFEMIFDQFTQQNLPHRGIDFVASEGDTVFAPGAGVVAEVKTYRGFGLSMKINHTKDISTFYAHIGSPMVRSGERVNRGEPIALIAQSGRESSTGLHYEVRLKDTPINPENYFITK